MSYTIIRKSKLNTLYHGLKTHTDQIVLIDQVIKQVEAKKFSEALNVLKRLPRTNFTGVLNHMVEHLMALSIKEDKQKWLSEAQVAIGNILNRNFGELSTLSDTLLREIVGCLNANQGALFILNDEDPTDAVLEMKGCYAYNKKKYVEKRVGVTEGLLGQVFQEGELVYLTAVPSNYIKITSGLGEALPRCLVLMPVKANNEKVGVLELAFFHTLEPLELEFLSAISENIANTILKFRTTKQIETLLQLSKESTEQLQRQEQELRQSIEEMSAIQEELQRQNQMLEVAMKEVEIKNTEIQRMRENETELIESKLMTQQIIHDKIADKLRMKIEQLQKQAELKFVNN